MIRALLIIVLALVTALGWSLWRTETHKGDKEAAEVRAKSAEDELAGARQVIAEERGRVSELNTIAATELQEKTNAQNRANRLAAELASGERRVRHEIAALYTAQLSGAVAAASQPDYAAQRGAELVAAAIGVGAACDAREKALIQAYEVNRTGSGKTPAATPP